MATGATHTPQPSLVHIVAFQNFLGTKLASEKQITCHHERNKSSARSYTYYVWVYHLLLGWWWLSHTAFGETSEVNQERKKKMAKNLMKKGLAVLASSALGAAALVGVATPAYAANELKIEPASGTIYAVSAAEAFTIKTSFSPGQNSSGQTAQLKYVVTDTSAIPGQKAIHSGVSATVTDVDEASDFSTVAVATTDSDNSAVIAAHAAAIGYAGFEIASPSTSTTYSIQVQAFVDADGDNVIDSGEWTSNTETITFLKDSAVGFDLDLTGVTRQSTSVEVRATSTNVNIQQMYGDATTGSRFIGKAYTGGTNLIDGAQFLLTYDSVNEWLDATVTPTALAASESVKAEVFLSDATITTVAANATASTTNALATRIEAVGVATIQAGMAAIAPVANKDVKADRDYASGSGSFVATTAVTYATGYGAGDVTLTWTLAESGANTIQGDGYVEINGVRLVNNQSGTTEDVDTTATTDVDGISAVTITYSGLDAGDTFTLTATAEGETAAAVTFTAEDRDLTTLENTNAVGANDDSAQLVFPVGQNVVLTYAATDQYGKAWTTAGGSVVVAFGGKSATGAISNGLATVTLEAFTAAQATAGTASATTTLNGTAKVSSEPDVLVKIGAQAAATAITATADSHTTSASLGALNVKASASRDTRIGDAAPEVTSGSVIVISGTVTDSLLNPIPADITVSAPGLMFEKDGVWSTDSITIRSTSAGAYTVDVYSNLSGAQTVTVTSGSATKTEVIYLAAAADSAGTSLVVTAPSYVLPGSTLQIKGALTDKFGNAVDAGGTNTSAAGADFKITYVGPGLLVASTPTSTDADGNANVNYLLGQNDSGTITVTYSYDANGDADYADAGDLVVVKTITIGAEPATKKVNAGSFKGYVAVYAKGYEGQRLSAKIGKDWVIVDPIVNNQENGTLFRVTDFTGAGVDIAVRIYIDRVLLDTINLTTK